MVNNAVRNGGRERGAASNVALIVIGSLILVALVGVIVALVMLLNRGESQPEPEETPQRSILITEDNVEEILDEMITPIPPAPSSYDVSMTMDWTFPDGTSPSPDAFVANVESNTTDMYFDVSLRDTGEIIYQSPVMPVGSELENFALDTPLDAGVYPCVVEYHLVDENQNTLGTVNMGLTITVRN